MKSVRARPFNWKNWKINFVVFVVALSWIGFLTQCLWSSFQCVHSSYTKLCVIITFSGRRPVSKWKFKLCVCQQKVKITFNFVCWTHKSWLHFPFFFSLSLTHLCGKKSGQIAPSQLPFAKKFVTFFGLRKNFDEMQVLELNTKDYVIMTLPSCTHDTKSSLFVKGICFDYILFGDPLHLSLFIPKVTCTLESPVECVVFAIVHCFLLFYYNEDMRFPWKIDARRECEPQIRKTNQFRRCETILVDMQNKRIAHQLAMLVILPWNWLSCCCCWCCNERREKNTIPKSRNESTIKKKLNRFGKN